MIVGMNGSSIAGALGLMGGLGVPATLHYYRNLVSALEEGGREAEIVIVHANMRRAIELVQAGKLDALAEYLASLIGRMAAAGATLAVIPAITPHICAAQLAAVSPIPFVNILDAIADEIRRRGLKRVALFGTRFTIESHLFGRLEDVEVVSPKPHEIDTIHATYLQLASGEGDPDEHRRLLRALAKELCRRESLDAILLAGTDLSLVFKESNTDFPHLDCAQAHLEAIARAVLQARAAG